VKLPLRIPLRRRVLRWTRFGVPLASNIYAGLFHIIEVVEISPLQTENFTKSEAYPRGERYGDREVIGHCFSERSHLCTVQRAITFTFAASRRNFRDRGRGHRRNFESTGVSGNGSSEHGAKCAAHVICRSSACLAGVEHDLLNIL